MGIAHPQKTDDQWSSLQTYPMWCVSVGADIIRPFRAHRDAPLRIRSEVGRREGSAQQWVGVISPSVIFGNHKNDSSLVRGSHRSRCETLNGIVQTSNAAESKFTNSFHTKDEVATLGHRTYLKRCRAKNEIPAQGQRTNSKRSQDLNFALTTFHKGGESGKHFQTFPKFYTGGCGRKSGDKPLGCGLSMDIPQIHRP